MVAAYWTALSLQGIAPEHCQELVLMLERLSSAAVGCFNGRTVVLAEADDTVLIGQTLADGSKIHSGLIRQEQL